MAVTLRFQSTGAVPGDGEPIVMRGPNLTIGRGPENDVVLPDPDRLISKNHCAIEDQNGNVVVIDFSTNGTFLNYGKIPLGRVPTPLNDGDVLTMGNYELVVSITSGRPDPVRDLAPPVDDLPVSHGSAEAAPELMDLFEDHSSKRTDFLDDLMGEATPKGHRQIVREDPIDELDLPHLADAEDPILGRIPDPIEDPLSPIVGQHTPAMSDSYRPSARKANVIPDDWDEDLLAPTPRGGAAGRGAGGGSAADPFAAPAPPRRTPSPLPADAFDDLAPRPAPAAARPTSVAPPTPGPLAPLPTASVVPRPPTPRNPDEAASPFAAPVPPGRTSSVVPPPTVSAEPAAVSATASAPAPKPPPAAAAPVSPAAAGPAAAFANPAAAGEALRLLLEGAGAEDVVISDADAAATLHRLGVVLRVLIEGLREVLMTRAEIKGEFRMERTQISAGGNNPLKFALSPEHAVEMILRPRAKGYMDAPTAVKEALDDIKAHEVAMVTGMEAAIKDVLKRLDPAVLGERVSGGVIGGLLGGKKARMWEAYEKLYGTIANEAENDFHEVFAKAFARAYQDQLERLK